MGTDVKVALIRTACEAAVRHSLALLLALLACISDVTAADPRRSVAEAFLRGIYTGQQLRAEDWLTQETRSSEAFVGFGGLDALVRQSTERAERYGGLKSVRILSARNEGGEYVVVGEVRFKRDPQAADTRAMSTHERMIWELRVVLEEGKWKLAL